MTKIEKNLLKVLVWAIGSTDISKAREGLVKNKREKELKLLDKLIEDDFYSFFERIRLNNKCKRG